MASTRGRKKNVISEIQLDRAFADHLACSQEFREWVLSRTKFRPYAKQAALLAKEQAAAKPRKKPENWWRHWWCRLDNGSESETDIFATFQLHGTNLRFALHIEDKPPHGKFTPNQYLNYKQRAVCMAKQAKYMDYSDFATVLLAPSAFIASHMPKVSHFDCAIPYESVAAFIPLFGESLSAAAVA
jgi:hypothetical protein